MKRLARLLIGGQSLRHRPVALREGEQRQARARVTSRGEARDVTATLVPVSLSPLVLGLHSGDGDALPLPSAGFELAMEDAESSVTIGGLRLNPDRVVATPDDRVLLLRPTGSSVRCASTADRAWRYALAWRQVRSNLKTPHAFRMSFADLRALNVFYMMARPVFLVSVVHEDRSNIFPMDLAGPVGADGFLLALRRTSPAVELMRASGRIVVSSMPAALKQVIYRLGDHHGKASIDWAQLPIPVQPSPTFAIPAPVDAFRVRELRVRHSEDVGSHAFFLTRVVTDTRHGDEPQLCHVSDMYARWREARGRPFADA